MTLSNRGGRLLYSSREPQGKWKWIRKRLRSMIAERSERRQPESHQFFMFYSMRKSGLSPIEACKELARLDSKQWHLIFAIANASDIEFEKMRRDSQSSFHQWESLLSIKEGPRTRLHLIETKARNRFRIRASSMQMKMIVLTFFVSIVPFAGLVSWFYLSSSSSQWIIAFFLVYPVFLSLISKWARMRDETLVR